MSAVPRPGEPFVVTKGTPVHSMRNGQWKPAGRKLTVNPWRIDTYGAWTQITWSGSGGYWQRVVIDPSGEFVARWPS